MTNSVSEYRCSHASSAVPAQVFWISGLHHLIIDSEISHITPRVGTRNLVKWNSGTFKTLKDNFKELALLWIHRSRFEVINAKETVLEGSNVVLEEVAALGVHAAGPVYALGMIEGVDIEPRAWNTTLSRAAVCQQIPKLGNRSGVSG